MVRRSRQVHLSRKRRGHQKDICDDDEDNNNNGDGNGGDGDGDSENKNSSQEDAGERNRGESGLTESTAVFEDVVITTEDLEPLPLTDREEEGLDGGSEFFNFARSWPMD